MIVSRKEGSRMGKEKNGKGKTIKMLKKES
jgi:hypothetical protein